MSNGCVDRGPRGLDIFQAVPRDHRHHAGAAPDDALRHRAAQAGDSRGGRGFGENAGQPAGVAHGLENLLVAHVDHGAAGFRHRQHGFLPVPGDAHRDAVGERVRLDGPHRFAGAKSRGDGGGAFRLHAQHPGSALRQPQDLHLPESLPDSGDGAAVSHRNGHPIGGLPTELLADFEAHGLLAFHQVRIDAGIAVVPAPPLAGLLAQLESLLVAAAHAKNRRAENQQLRDLRLRRAFRHEDDAAQPHGGRHARARRCRIPGAGAGDDLAALFPGLDHAHGAGAVLQRAGGIAAIVLQKESAHAEVAGQGRGRGQRRPPHRESRQCGIRADGQQLAVSPVRLLRAAGQPAARQAAGDGRVVELARRESPRCRNAGRYRARASNEPSHRIRT